MIEINLRPGQKRVRKVSPLEKLREWLRSLSAGVTDPMRLATIAAWLVAIVGVGGWWFTTNTSVGALEQEIEEVRAEHRRFQGFLKQKQKQEMVRDSLFAQISTIRQVDGDRYVWAHVLDEVTRALPPFTWLVSVAASGGAAPGTPAAQQAAAQQAAADSAGPRVLKFTLVGRTADIQAYTRYLRDLEASPWIANVTPLQAQTVIEADRPLTAFTIVADFTPADSAFIATVPLVESVR